MCPGQDKLQSKESFETWQVSNFLITLISDDKYVLACTEVFTVAIRRI